MERALPPTEDGIPAAHPVAGRDPAQEELQVRQTAQRILAAHLHLPPGISSAAAQRRQPSPRRAFWPGISLDLTGAALVDFNLSHISVLQGRFSGATFQGFAGFIGATFQGLAGFSRATFQGAAAFDLATFQDAAQFIRATFQGHVMFSGATFQNPIFPNAFDAARVLHMDNPVNERVWPDGWTVRPDPARLSIGTLVSTDPARIFIDTLVPAEQAEKPEPAAPPSDPTG